MEVAGVSAAERRPPKVLAPEPGGEITPAPAPPTFSLVITAYEAAGTIAEAVRSALDQTHPALEVIVVDDGSRDHLDVALAPFGDAISLVRKENGGGASARNAGVAAARGDFMAILDADDRYDRRRLEAIAGLARARPDLDLVTTDAAFVVDGEVAGTFLEHNTFATVDQRTAIFASCFPGGWPAVRLAPLRAIGGFDEQMRIAYDWDCWLRLLLAGSMAGIVAEPLYEYVLHGGSLAASRAASLHERVVLLEHARANPDLREAERPALDRELRRHRDGAANAAIEGALAGEGDRRAVVRTALDSGIGWRVRARAGLAAASPALARRLSAPPPPPEQRFRAAER
jgi:hypothetical protein